MGRLPGSPNKPKTGSTTRSKNTKEKELKKCLKCEKDKPIKEFYVSYSDQHSNGLIPYCDDCIKPEDENDINQVMEKLRWIDRPFILNTWQKTKTGNKVASRGNKIFGNYLRVLNLNKKTRMLTYQDSDYSQKATATPAVGEKPIEITNTEIDFNDEDMRSKQDCQRLLGYDPFDGYEICDQRILYAELLPYLDEDTLEDQYKIQVIIQILNNNIQIRKIDLTVNNLSSDSETLLKNAATIKSLTSTKKEIAMNNDKLAKENAIAIKHRGDKKAGRSTLGYLMRDLRELGFEKAEENYYDMKKAYGMQVTADISVKAILTQLNFDEKDIEDMFKEQRDLIIELQNKNEELEEKLRLVTVELKNVVTK